MSFKNIYFILVRPQLGENIGSTARALKNFNFTKLRIVNPRSGWPNQKAIALLQLEPKIFYNHQKFTIHLINQLVI